MSTALAASPILGAAALLALKSTLLLGAAALGARALRRSSAARRHLLWTLALGALLALPALALALPAWRPSFLALPSAPAADPEPAVYVSSEIVRFASDAAPVVTPLPAEETSRFPLAAVLVGVWAAGALVVLARLAVGLAVIGRMARGAEEVRDPAWTELAARLGAAVGVRRPVRLLRGGDAAMPMTWGVLRPVVLLPVEADGWTAERRRVVLLHELAHVARADCLTQCLAEVACALHWFHPGAWWAARRMRMEREQACDDRVLAASGGRASDYAAHLLDVARASRAPVPAAALAMARPSHLEGRLRAVLDPERDRGEVTARTGAICAGAVLLAALPLAAVSPSSCCAPAEEDEPRRVSLVLPVQAEMGPQGTARGKAKTRATINGEEVELDLDLQVTLVPGRARDEETWRAPAFTAPEHLPAFASLGGAEDGKADAEDVEDEGHGIATFAGLTVEEDHGRLTFRLKGDGDVRRELFSVAMDASVRDEVTTAFARLASHRGDGRAAAEPGDECPEKRKARETVRAQLAAGLRDAREQNPEAMGIAAMFVDLDQVVDAVSTIVANEMTIESR